MAQSTLFTFILGHFRRELYTRPAVKYVITILRTEITVKKIRIYIYGVGSRTLLLYEWEGGER